MTSTRNFLRSSAAVALVAALGLGLAGNAATAQTQPDPIQQGVTPGDPTGGLPPQTVPDDDTVLPPDLAPGATAQPGVPAQPLGEQPQIGATPEEAEQPRRVVVLPDGTRVDAADGEFVEREDGSRFWVYQGVEYPVIEPGTEMGADGLPGADADAMTEAEIN
jgi:hypothetical protein